MKERAALCILVAVLLSPLAARAEDPPCEYELSMTQIDRGDLDACVEISLSSCYIAVEGSVTNNCTSPITLEEWFGEPEGAAIEPGGVEIFAALERTDTSTEEFSEQGVIAIDGVDYPVTLTATVVALDTGDDGCAATAPRAPARGAPWLALGLFALALARRRGEPRS